MLTTDALQDPDADLALGELMRNARKLAIGGLASESFGALALLVQPGPWRMPKHGQLVTQLQRLLPPVALLAGQACPPIGDQAAIAPEELGAWAEGEASGQLAAMTRATRTQLRPAGADWTPDFLATLPECRGSAGDGRQHLAFGNFCGDADFVLRARLADRFGAGDCATDVPSEEELKSLGFEGDVLAQMLEQLRQPAIEVAAAAQGTGTVEIARAVRAYCAATGFSGGYLAQEVLAACWVLLAEEGRDAEAVEVAAGWIAQDEDALQRILDLASLPGVARVLRTGALAPALRVDANLAGAWLDALPTRKESTRVAPPVPRAGPPPVIALEDAVGGTLLEQLSWQQVPVLDTGERAWVAAIPVKERKVFWQAARAVSEQTGRWPVVTTLWSEVGDPPEAERLSDDLFNRFSYEQGPARDDLTPASFIATSAAIEPEELLSELAAIGSGLDESDEIDIWKRQLETDGIPLDGFEEAWAACNGDRLRFERWLADLEERSGKADPERGRQTDFEPDNTWLVMLPSPHSEDTLAYLHWFGMERGQPDGFIALLRSWRETYGAELFAHYGTMLEFVVTRPPQEMDAALRLAREHDLAAPCTLALPGIPLHHHARGLIAHHEWFLHERP